MTMKSMSPYYDYMEAWDWVPLIVFQLNMY